MDTIYYIIICFGLCMFIGSPIILLCYDISRKNKNNYDINYDIQFEKKSLIIKV
jgi:hypothetical protein